MVILVEGSSPGSSATKSQLNNWISKVPQPFTGTLDSVDPQPLMEDYFGVPRDQFIVVDLKTMKMVEVVQANPKQAIADVEAMLGN